MLFQRWKTWVILSLLALATWPAVACSKSSSGQGPPCSPLSGPTVTLDQEVTSLCANVASYYGGSVGRGTMECGGLLAVAEVTGLDTDDLYLFDPTTRELVETMSGANGHMTCTGSATAADLTYSPAVSACVPLFYEGYGGGGWGFQDVCDRPPPPAPPEAGLPDTSSSDASSE